LDISRRFLDRSSFDFRRFINEFGQRAVLLKLLAPCSLLIIGLP
jgi:hypothetical protein